MPHLQAEQCRWLAANQPHQEHNTFSHHRIDSRSVDETQDFLPKCRSTTLCLSIMFLPLRQTGSTMGVGIGVQPRAILPSDNCQNIGSIKLLLFSYPHPPRSIVRYVGRYCTDRLRYIHLRGKVSLTRAGCTLPGDPLLEHSPLQWGRLAT